MVCSKLNNSCLQRSNNYYCINGVVRSRGRGKRSAERRKVNVLAMKCWISLFGVSRIDRVRNEDVRRRAGVERKKIKRKKTVYSNLK